MGATEPSLNRVKGALSQVFELRNIDVGIPPTVKGLMSTLNTFLIPRILRPESLKF